MTKPILSPGTDLVLGFWWRQPNDEGRSEPVTTGSPTAFLSSSNDAEDADPLDPTLEVIPTHVAARPGLWIAKWNASVLMKASLQPFESNTPYAIFRRTGDVSQYQELQYMLARPMLTE